MRLVATFLVGMMLVAALAGTVSGAEEEDTCAVLFDFGNGQVMWADVPLEEGMDAFNVTEDGAAFLGLVLTSSNWGTDDSPDMFVDLIDGQGFNAATWEYWGFWTWNSTTSSWEMAMIGPSAIPASTVEAVAWRYAATYDPPLATPEHRYPWASFRHDAANTGSQLSYNASNIALAWQKDLSNGAIDAPIVSAGGYVYIVTGGVMNATNWGAYDSDSLVYCLDSAGAIMWNATIGTGFQVGAPLILGDQLIVPSANGKVYAFDLETGASEWVFETGSGNVTGVTSSPIAYLDQIIVAAGNGKLFSLYWNGTEAWNLTIAPVVSNSYEAKAIYSSSPAVADGVIYIGSTDGKLHAVAADGSGEQWSITVGNETKGSPLLLDDMIVITYLNYTPASSGGLAAVSYEGEMLWQTATGVSPASPALTAQGIAVVASDGLTMIDLDGNKLWTCPLGTTFSGGAPTAIDGTVFVVTNEAHSRILAISDDGQIVWQQALDPAQYALCAPTVVDGMIYVTADNGLVYAFDLNAAEAISPKSSEFPTLLVVGILSIVIVAAVGVVYWRGKKKGL